MKRKFYRITNGTSESLWLRGNGRGLYAWPNIDESNDLPMVATFDTIERAKKQADIFGGAIREVEIECIDL